MCVFYTCLCVDICVCLCAYYSLHDFIIQCVILYMNMYKAEHTVAQLTYGSNSNCYTRFHLANIFLAGQTISRLYIHRDDYVGVPSAINRARLL